MRNPDQISEEIRNADVAAAAADDEMVTLLSRPDLTPGEQQRAKQLQRGAANHAAKKADLEHEYRAAVAARATAVAEIRNAAGNAAALEDGTSCGPTLVSGRSLSDGQLWGSQPDFRGQSHADIAKRADAILARSEDMGPVDKDAVERIAALVESDEQQSYAARFVSASSDPNYASALGKIRYGANDANGRLRWTESETTAFLRAETFRAAMNTTGATGGYLIPFFLDPSIVLTNTGQVNSFRQISRVETISTGVWHGVSSAGVNAEWQAEASEVTDASPTLVQPSVSTIRADAYIQASIELQTDSTIGNQISVLFADAKDRLEAAAFATGTGSTQPEGIVTRLAATSASKVNSATNAAFGGVDLFALVNSLPARYQDRASWVGHWGIANLIRQFTSSAAPQAGNFWTDLGGGTPPELLGAPFYRASAMASSLSASTASTDNILVLGDFSDYLIVDSLGSQIVFNPLVLGANRRPTGEVGWVAFWRTGADTLNADAFRMLVC